MVLGGPGSMSVTRRSNRAGTGSASVTVHGSGWGWWRSRRWAGGADGMRGDGVGVGDVGAVPGGAWGTGHAAGGDDGWGAGREHEQAMSLWTLGAERDATVNRAGTGSASVTVHGSGLGLVAFTALGRVGQTGCEGTEWESETSVRCLVGHGARGTRRVVMTAGEREGAAADGLVDLAEHERDAATNRAGRGRRR